MKRIYHLLQPHCSEAVRVEHHPQHKIDRLPVIGVRRIAVGEVKYRCEHEVSDEHRQE